MGSGGMDSRLWSKLPVDLVERVLTFLPVVDLIRCSVLSKKWNEHITTRPDFAYLCFQNTKEECKYIVARCVEDYQQGSDIWSYYVSSVLDLKAQRWYTIKHGVNWHTIIIDHVNHQSPKLFKSVFMGADAGLVCEYREFCITSKRITAMVPPCIEIFNPITRTSICDVPLPPCYDPWEWAASAIATHENALMAFVVDNPECNRFKIFFLYNHESEVETAMFIYESITKQWRTATSPPLELELVVSRILGSYVVFHGVLYVVFVTDTASVRTYELFGYKAVDDVWENTGVHIQCNQGLSVTELIVADNRLFLIHWELNDVLSQYPRLHMDEVVLKEKGILAVSQMGGDLLNSVFCLPQAGSRGMWSWPTLEFRSPEIEVFGFDKSILLMSRKTGISVVYDLVSHLWSQLPARNPLDPAGPGCEMWFGKPMSLRLPCLLP